MIWKILVLLIGLLPVVWPTGARASAAAEKRGRQVLILHSYQRATTRLSQFSDSFFRVMRSGSGRYDFHELELKYDAADAADTADALFRQILPQLRQGKFDAVVAVGDSAAEIVRRNLDEMPRRIPLVVADTLDYFAEIRKKHPRSVAIPGRAPVRRSIELALQLCPRTRKIILLTNSAPGGKLVRELAKKALIRNPTVSLLTFTPERFSREELFRVVKDSEGDTVVLYHDWMPSRTSTYAGVNRELMALDAAGKVPIFLLRADNINPPVVGGCGVFGGDVGAAAGEAVLRGLGGDSFADLPLVAVPQRSIFSYAGCSDKKIALEELPSSVTVYGNPGAVWTEHKMELFGIGVALFAVVGLAWMLIALHCARLKSEKRIRTMLRQLPVFASVCSVEGKLLFVAPESETMIGRFFDADGDFFRCGARTALDAKRPVARNFHMGEKDYAVTFAPLPENLFEQEAVAFALQEVASSSVEPALPKCPAAPSEPPAQVKNDAQEPTHRSLEVEFFQTRLSRFPLPFFLREAEGEERFLVVNAAFASLLERQPAEMEQHPAAEFFGQGESAEQWRFHTDSSDRTDPEMPRCCEGRVKLPGAEHSTQNFRLIQLAYSGSENRDLIFGTILKTEEIPAE
ncbi:MAG: hypothetical protein PHS41_12625, partial [Victivallaceae bacterium]|nr:hypothetical protein [Victivallaceae bacterium]